MQPIVSVLMSCYNAEAWLCESIESVLNQTFTNFEFLIIDDGSVDGTLNLLRQYEKKDPRIKVIVKQNTGLSDSLNVGIAQAQGEWIARIDADDLCEPERLAAQVQFVQKNPQVGLLGTGFLEIDAEGKVVGIHREPASHDRLLFNLSHCKRYIIHSSAFYNTALVRQVGGYRPRARLAEDLDLWLRISEKKQLACLEQPLIRYRKHTQQISRDQDLISQKQVIDSWAVIACYFLRTQGNPEPMAALDESDWSKFHDWVNRKVSEYQVFEYTVAWTKARDDLFSRKNQLWGRLYFFLDIVKSGHALRLLKIKVFGSNIPKQIAQQWVRGI
jgi:glycosyltransferase involved in cell wall biosynthesis